MGSFIVLFLAPLALFTNLYTAHTLSKLIVTGLGLFVWVGYAKPKRTTLDALILLALTLLCYSTWTSIDYYGSLIGYYNDYANGLMAVALYTCAFYIGTTTRKKTYRWSVASAVVISLSVLIEHYMFGVARPISTFGSAPHTGTFLAMNTILSLWICPWVAPLIGLGMFVTKSRGAIVACGIAIGCVYCIKGASWRSYLMAIGLAVSLLVASLSMFGGRRIGDTARATAWRIAVAQTKDYPMGQGLDTFSLSFRRRIDEGFRDRNNQTHFTDAHNDLLQVSGTAGVLPALLLLAGSLWVLFVSSRLRACAFGAMLVYFICAKFNPISFVPTILASMLAGMACKNRKSLPREPLRYVVSGLCLMLLFLYSVDARSRGSIMDLHASAVSAPWEPYYVRPLVTEYMRAGRDDEALEAAQNLHSLRPNLPEATYLLAYVNFLLVGKGRDTMDDAKKYLRMVEKQDGSFRPTQILRKAVDGYERVMNEQGMD